MNFSHDLGSPFTILCGGGPPAPPEGICKTVYLCTFSFLFWREGLLLLIDFSKEAVSSKLWTTKEMCSRMGIMNSIYKMFRKGKSLETERLVITGAGGGEGEGLPMDMRFFRVDWNVLKLDYGYPTLYIYWKSLNCTLQWVILWYINYTSKSVIVNNEFKNLLWQNIKYLINHSYILITGWTDNVSYKLG